MHEETSFDHLDCLFFKRLTPSWHNSDILNVLVEEKKYNYVDMKNTIAYLKFNFTLLFRFSKPLISSRKNSTNKNLI